MKKQLKNLVVGQKFTSLACAGIVINQCYNFKSTTCWIADSNWRQGSYHDRVIVTLGWPDDFVNPDNLMKERQLLLESFEEPVLTIADLEPGEKFTCNLSQHGEYIGKHHFDNLFSFNEWPYVVVLRNKEGGTEVNRYAAEKEVRRGWLEE